MHAKEKMSRATFLNATRTRVDFFYSRNKNVILFFLESFFTFHSIYLFNIFTSVSYLIRNYINFWF